MSIADLVKRAGKLVADNSPLILTAIGVTGTLTTAYLTGKASFKAAHIIEHERNRRSLRIGEPQEVEIREQIDLTWKLYIPAAGTAIGTIACIIMANRIGNRRASALAAAYAISDKAFEEYRAKIADKLGPNKEQAVRDEIAQDQVSANPPVSKEIIITGNGDVLCRDAYSGRYFDSSADKLMKAQNQINYQILNDNYASLTDFYNLIGLPPTSVSDEVGWKASKDLELRISGTVSTDQRPCLNVEFSVEPIRGFYKGY